MSATENLENVRFSSEQRSNLIHRNKVFLLVKNKNKNTTTSSNKSKTELPSASLKKIVENCVVLQTHLDGLEKWANQNLSSPNHSIFQ